MQYVGRSEPCSGARRAVPNLVCDISIRPCTALTRRALRVFLARLIETYCIVVASGTRSLHLLPLRISRRMWGAVALLWFDYALTLPGEYRRIWRRKFTGATLIFLLMRYATLIERIPFVLEVLVWNSSDRVSSVHLRSLQYIPITLLSLQEYDSSGVNKYDVLTHLIGVACLRTWTIF